MRAFLLLLVLVGLVIFALSGWQPGVAAVPLPTITPTLLPDDFTLLPTFEPSFPCELEQVDVRDEDLCRSEAVSERVLADGDGVTFIQHDYTMAQGCWGSIRQDIHELRVCQRESGAVTVLSDALVTDLLMSADEAWYIFGTMSMNALGEDTLNPHLYRVRVDGTDLQQLDAQGLPDFAVGAPTDLRWLDGGWLHVRLWTGREGEYRSIRLKADGSGEYKLLPEEVIEGD
jgi:hypothetical protein